MIKISCFALSALLVAGAGAAWAQRPSPLERGKYLMEGVAACGNCHFARGEQGQPLPDKGLSGGMLFDTPAFKVYAANITPDRETGIGKWTDAQLALAIREGVRPGNRMIGPPMPIEFYRAISDDDLGAIIAYLRAQPAVRNEVPPAQYNVALPISYGLAIANLKAPAIGDKVRYGEYLASIGHCMHCHTQLDDKGMTQAAKLGAGGQVFEGPWGVSMSRNLTPHETGLKNWTDAQIAKVLHAGTGRDGQHYKPPMAFDFYKNINDADVGALIAYLRSLKALPFAGKNQ